jgi:hypothetical protein
MCLSEARAAAHQAGGDIAREARVIPRVIPLIPVVVIFHLRYRHVDH